MSGCRKIRNLIAEKWHILRHGDCYENWKSVLFHAGIHDEESRWDEKCLVIQIILTTYSLLSAVRFLSAAFLRSDGDDYTFGHSLLRNGSIGRVACFTAGLAFAQAFMMRIFYLRSGFQPILVLQTLKQMLRHPDPVIRSEKTRMARNILTIAVVAYVVQALDCYAIGIPMLGLNCPTSKSWIEILLRIFWWTQDILICALYELDMCFFPAICFLLVIDVRTDLRLLIAEVKRSSSSSPSENQTMKN